MGAQALCESEDNLLGEAVLGAKEEADVDGG